jgi:hypothetical protein
MSVIKCAIGRYHAFVTVFNKYLIELCFLNAVEAVRRKYVRTVEHSKFVASLMIDRTYFICLTFTQLVNTVQ